MNLRTTPDESGTPTTSSPPRYPTGVRATPASILADAALADAALVGGGATDRPEAAPPEPVGEDPRTESRRELRAARHHRRRIMVVCALVITACVVMTVLIVGMARDQKPVAQAAGAVPVPRSHRPPPPTGPLS